MFRDRTITWKSCALGEAQAQGLFKVFFCLKNLIPCILPTAEGVPQTGYQSWGPMQAQNLAIYVGTIGTDEIEICLKRTYFNVLN